MRDDGPIGQDGLDADDLRACHAVRDDVDAPGVGGDGAADGGGVAGREVDAVVPAGGRCVPAHVAERGARTCRELPGQVVDGIDRRESTGRQDHGRLRVGGSRHRATDQTGVAALRQHRHAGIGARAHDQRHLGGGARAHDRERGAAEAT